MLNPWKMEFKNQRAHQMGPGESGNEAEFSLLMRLQNITMLLFSELCHGNTVVALDT